MRTLLISYDLADPYRNKHIVVQNIMKLGTAWARPLEQTWYVRTDATEGEIEKRLSPLLASDDGLLVQAVRDEAAMTNTTLRWFKPRTMFDADEGAGKVVAFPMAIQPRERGGLELAATG